MKELGIAYENDIEKAKELIHCYLDKEEAIVHDETHVHFVAEEELAASTVYLKVYFWFIPTTFAGVCWKPAER